MARISKKKAEANIAVIKQNMEKSMSKYVWRDVMLDFRRDFSGYLLVWGLSTVICAIISIYITGGAGWRDLGGVQKWILIGLWVLYVVFFLVSRIYFVGQMAKKKNTRIMQLLYKLMGENFFYAMILPMVLGIILTVFYAVTGKHLYITSIWVYLTGAMFIFYALLSALNFLYAPGFGFIIAGIIIQLFFYNQFFYGVILIGGVMLLGSFATFLVFNINKKRPQALSAPDRDIISELHNIKKTLNSITNRSLFQELYYIKMKYGFITSGVLLIYAICCEAFFGPINAAAHAERFKQYGLISILIWALLITVLGSYAVLFLPKNTKISHRDLPEILKEIYSPFTMWGYITFASVLLPVFLTIGGMTQYYFPAILLVFIFSKYLVAARFSLPYMHMYFVAVIIYSAVLLFIGSPHIYASIAGFALIMFCWFATVWLDLGKKRRQNG